MLKTYSHLSGKKRIPSPYEVMTTDLDYHNQRGLELNLTMTHWLQQYRCSFECKNWNEFSDPRETTYSLYTHIQRDKNIFVQRILLEIQQQDFDKNIEKPWLSMLENFFITARYPLHGMQMVSSYLGCLAPNSRITVAHLFESADMVRWIETISKRGDQIAANHLNFGNTAKTCWEKEPFWQPFREVIERLLVTYDWAEAFIAHNLVVKPLFAKVFFTFFCKLAVEHKDIFLQQILSSFREDYEWQKDWTVNLVALLARQSSENSKKIKKTLDKWIPKTIDACRNFSVLNQALWAKLFSEMIAQYSLEIEFLEYSLAGVNHEN